MKRFFLFIVFLVSATVLFAQEGAKGFSKEKLFAGGGFGLSFGNYTFINLAPQIGYRFNRFLAAGTGLNLIYTSQKEKDIYSNDYSKTVQGITGLNLFGRFYPAQKFLVQIQPEANYMFGNVTYYQEPAKGKYKLDTEIVPSLLAGGGFVIPSDKGELITTVMYDLLQDARSPYGNRPLINVGYNFHF